LKGVTLDIARHIGAIYRELDRREQDGKPARVMLATRTFDSDIDDVWNALTDPERLPRWFLPISGELREGGHYQLEGNAGGRILRCDPPRLLALTWDMRGSSSWVTVRLTAEAELTQLQLEHVAHVEDEFWDQFGPGAVGVGWDLTLLGLALHLAGDGASIDAAKRAEWPASEEGRGFITGSSEGWVQASIAAGTDAAAAVAAGDRTTAFYTGVPEPA
jgi:uncharacterized protein YndB with AHSA1/START domain